MSFLLLEIVVLMLGSSYRNSLLSVKTSLSSKSFSNSSSTLMHLSNGNMSLRPSCHSCSSSLNSGLLVCCASDLLIIILSPLYLKLLISKRLSNSGISFFSLISNSLISELILSNCSDIFFSFSSFS